MTRVGIIGLGYVGLPLAIEFVRAGQDVVGIDLDARKTERIAAGDSYVEDVSDADLVAAASSGRFLATTDITVEGSPTLKVTLSADITAEALSGTFEERWLWRLAEKEWGSAFRLAMVLPLRYASDEPFRLPALSDIRFQGPDLDLPSLLPALAEMAAG